MKLTGSTALVTGASGGIGEEFATRPAAAGLDPFLVARRTDRLKELRAEQDPVANAAQIQMNCVTLVELTGHLLPAMIAARRGVVLNVGSTAGFQPVPGMAVYGATKAFVLPFSEALWQETRAAARASPVR